MQPQGVSKQCLYQVEKTGSSLFISNLLFYVRTFRAMRHYFLSRYVKGTQPSSIKQMTRAHLWK